MKWQAKSPKRKYRESDDILTKLACTFGIEDLEEYINPSEGSLHDPYLLSNIEDVSNQILKALGTGRKIRIVADIDADGITSCAIMYNYLRQFSNNIDYIYAQRSDGHGLHTVVNQVEGTELLVIVDSSTSEGKSCGELREKFPDLDILIIDHHPPVNENPYATIVNAQLCDYPNKELSGAGHCLKVIQVLDDNLCSDSWENFYDLAGVGIHADQMSMAIPENRYIVKRALDGMRNIGLLAILKHGKRDPQELTSSDIGFTIAPYLNGASRMDKIELALECLTTDDPEVAKKLAQQIGKLNNKRKTEQKKRTDEFLTQVDWNDKVAIIVSDTVEKGFAGLVANDIAGKIQRPTVILSEDENGKLSGSFRSINGFKLRSFFENLPEVKFHAGHEGAGGISISKEDLESFRRSCNDGLKNQKFERVLYYDLELDAGDISRSLVEDIMKFTRISGKDAWEAKFKVANLLALDKQLMGKKQDTIKISTDVMDLMKFRSDQKFFDNAPSDYETIEAVGSLNINKFFHWGERKWYITNQMYLEDYTIV